MTIEINNLTKFRLDKKLYTGLAKKVIKGENKEIELKNLSIAFVSTTEIKKANKKYRGKDNPTDVLSFGESLNEILICPDVVKKNAEKFGVSFKNEIAKILIHGALHLCGYDHEKSEKEAEVMEQKENFYLNK
jgi:probable rRNA maturation factor